MSVMRGINVLLLVINIILYCTVVLVFYGAFFQIILGGYQVFVAIVLLFFWTTYNKEEKIKLLVYWFTIIFYGLAWKLDILDKIDNEILVLFVIPMCIAVLFTVFLEGLGNKYKKVL